ncbi:AAA-like domain-containing protein [Pseudanabaena yagii]|uniref:CHAT domain-containing protein n=1 Tax=Pseudanabaena yagii GIHE-NHR1 TaxID=2722753 RepID=A0ABX1LPD8_9CYAN|nr:CHAT domain-containing protein [Pseudanabaena yagii GIHE-NHR1]
MDKKKVLLLSANPSNTDRLRVEAEFREIEACCQKSSLRDRFAIVAKGAVRIDDLQPILLQEVPRVVHFSGHGAAENGLVLENDAGDWQLAPTDALAELFRILQNGIDCVVLNACFSQVQAEAIARYVPYVLGMNQAIGDVAAIEFAKGFYGALFEGKSVKDAFELGKNLIALKNIPEVQTPVLLERSYERQVLPRVNLAIEEPEGAVRIGSQFYIPRSPQEEQAFKAIAMPHALIRLKSPDRMGKSSLLVRVLEEARQLGNRTTWLDLQKCDRKFFENMDRFLQWFCAVIGRDFGVKAKPTDDWDEMFGANGNCEEFFERYLLNDDDDRPLVIAIENLDRIFLHEAIEVDFCGLLRGWHEQGKHDKTWGKLRLVLAYSMESFSTKDINQSPFNVGTPIDLDEFTIAQVQELAALHGLSAAQIEPIANLVGGHPYLVRMAFYNLASGANSLEPIIQGAATEVGLFGKHLTTRLAKVEKDTHLTEVLRSLVNSQQPIRFDLATTAKLDGMGLILRTETGVKIRNELYRRYFQNRLGV